MTACFQWMELTFAWLWDIESRITAISLKKVGIDMRLACASKLGIFAGGVGPTHLESGVTK